jgi:ABC-type molybdate transport system substrate-binding protein
MNSAVASPPLTQRWLTSAALLLGSLVLTYAPLPGFRQTLVVVSGSELQEPLTVLETTFEDQYPSIDLELEFQGSQDMIDRYKNNKNDFTPAVLIPASADFLAELTSDTSGEGLIEGSPQAIVKTYLVAVVWPERATALFPDGQWSWSRIEAGLTADRRAWGAIGGQAQWGSFDFTMTDPTRSNSGQLTLALWSRSHLGGGDLTAANVTTPAVLDLLSLVKRSLYQPARSTDDLLQSFITQGPNEADVAMVYESIALSRWSQASLNQGKAYQIFYPTPTMETVATAAIVRRNVDRKTTQAAQRFVEFLRQPAAQAVFIRYGFRPGAETIDMAGIPDSPWAQNIPGVQIKLSPEPLPALPSAVIQPLVQAWEQVP